MRDPLVPGLIEFATLLGMKPPCYFNVAIAPDAPPEPGKWIIHGHRLGKHEMLRRMLEAANNGVMVKQSRGDAKRCTGSSVVMSLLAKEQQDGEAIRGHRTPFMCFVDDLVSGAKSLPTFGRSWDAEWTPG